MRNFLLLILIIIVFISGYRIVTIYKNYQEAYYYYSKIQDEYIQVLKPEETVYPIVISSSPSPTIAAVKKERKTTATTTKNIIASTPEAKHTTTKKPPISVNFNKLKKKNKDIIGWIYSENTVINYPILQTSNNIYYLRHLMDKSYSVSGSIFLDSINNKYFKDANSILYGHHMRNGSMFASIEQYKEQEYFDSHSELWLLTPNQDYMIAPFAGLVVEPSREDYFMTNFIDPQTQQSYVKFALENSTFVGDFSPNSTDKLITLATCDYTFEGARFILVCTLVPVI